ncbi:MULTISPECIES: hypothetical protein [Pseudomonas]|uniref:hypothetical protein n=1 Tax=Pseudomonas TaxID=286 RepID=UPI0006CDBC31|nr:MULTISPECIES: hypothetical protein [Pseudomonas]KPG81748.1 hypothetical protein AEQ63_16010 [Pseudomonas sp. RIT-PI-o]PWB37001.1 hypothetical protein DCO47_06450 [Pseudomonas sp. NDM]UST63435.1 hypothetical protein NF673_22900 [Pseudomonas moraviensis]WPC28653.1 hypothetical protein OE648_02385 [Pseudomonas moraviensis]
MKILLVCKDIGGYARKLAEHLSIADQVCFIDTAALAKPFDRAPKILRRPLNRWAQLRQFSKAVAAGGRFDVALIINPAQIEPKQLTTALSASERRIAYLYDSFSRWPMSREALAVYDEVFSFDPENAEQYGLKKLHNFIYDDYVADGDPGEYSAFVVMAGKDRVPALEGLARAFDQLGVTDYKFLVQCKPIPGAHPGITFFEQRMSLESVGELVKRSRIILDISKPGQAGLSFRFFEAMAARKKVITTNRHVLDYDFYNPANILVIDEADPVIPESFVSAPYADIPAPIYRKYTLQGWTETVFASR